MNFRILTVVMVSLGTVACTPRVELAMPEKPIEININAKVEHEVRVKLEKDVSTLVKNNPDLF